MRAGYSTPKVNLTDDLTLTESLIIWSTCEYCSLFTYFHYHLGFHSYALSESDVSHFFRVFLHWFTVLPGGFPSQRVSTFFLNLNALDVSRLSTDTVTTNFFKLALLRHPLHPHPLFKFYRRPSSSQETISHYFTPLGTWSQVRRRPWQNLSPKNANLSHCRCAATAHCQRHRKQLFIDHNDPWL